MVKVPEKEEAVKEKETIKQDVPEVGEVLYSFKCSKCGHLDIVIQTGKEKEDVAVVHSQFEEIVLSGLLKRDRDIKELKEQIAKLEKKK
jgi:hypothetical protein